MTTPAGVSAYSICWLMGGSLGLILARDPWLFFFFTSVSGYALYGLIVHRGDDGARKAARRYLVMLILGDLLLFEVLITMAAEGGGSVLCIRR